jgi:hypothetical protein
MGITQNAINIQASLVLDSKVSEVCYFKDSCVEY